MRSRVFLAGGDVFAHVLLLIERVTFQHMAAQGGGAHRRGIAHEFLGKPCPLALVGGEGVMGGVDLLLEASIQHLLPSLDTVGVGLQVLLGP